MEFTGVIVAALFNQSSATKRFIESFFKNSFYSWQLILINNASTDDTFNLKQELNRLDPNSIWIENKSNVGCATAWNQGVRAALSNNATCIGVLNNDLYFPKDWDRDFVAVFEEEYQENEWIALSPHVDEKAFVGLEARALRFMKTNKKKFRSHLNPMCMFFSPEIFTKVGFFDERFFVTYEDADFFIRLKENGLNPKISGAGFIWHEGSVSRSNGPKDYELAARETFIEKWGSLKPIYRARYDKHGDRVRRKFWKFKEMLGLL